MPLHHSQEPLAQALRHVSDERWRSHQNNVTKTPISRYLSPGVEQQHGRGVPVTPPSSGSRLAAGGVGSNRSQAGSESSSFETRPVVRVICLICSSLVP